MVQLQNIITSFPSYETHTKKGMVHETGYTGYLYESIFSFVHPLECGRLGKVEILWYSKVLSHISEISDDLTVILSIPTICK